jgi:UDP-N-acetyl-2-amino-2-deoxyglucuronate dehydrogenase
VLNPWNLDALQELESESSVRIFNVLQLRIHPSLMELKQKIAREKSSKKHNVVLSYITSRGLCFGDVQSSIVHLSDKKRMSGFIELQNAYVTWFLSTDRNDLPEEAKRNDTPTFRSIKVDNEEVQFSKGFTDLHTRVYEEILAGKGFGIDDARPSIKLVHSIRASTEVNTNDNVHPYAIKHKQNSR